MGGTRSGTRKRRGRLAWKLLVGLVFALAADQVLQLVVLEDGYALGRRVAPFDPPLFCHRHVAAVERIEARSRGEAASPESYVFDAELGWTGMPDTGSGEYTYDWVGARVGERPLPRDKSADVTRIGAFGCSFTAGTEVKAKEAWPAVLDSEHPEIETANLGVAAHGIDQAFLRWRRVAGVLRADEVWLGLLPAAALRNLSTYRPAMQHWGLPVFTKPRFVIGADERLELVENPVTSEGELLRLLRDQREFVRRVGRADVWLRRVPAAYAPFGSHWSHRLATGRVLLTFLDRRGRDPAAWLRDEESEAFRLVRALVLRMAREVEARGSARFRFLILPGREDLAKREAEPRPYWQALVDALRREGVDVLDLSESLVAAGATREDRFWAERGHYSAHGNRVVASALYERWRGDR